MLANMDKYWVYICLIILLIFVLKDYGKYKGKTAEEWFTQYDEMDADYEELSIRCDEFKECVDGYAYSEDYDDLVQIKYMCF